MSDNNNFQLLFTGTGWQWQQKIINIISSTKHGLKIVIKELYSGR